MWRRVQTCSNLRGARAPCGPRPCTQASSPSASPVMWARSKSEKRWDNEIMRSIFLAQLTFMCGIMSKSEKIHFLRNGFRIRDEIPPLVCLSPVEIWNRYPQRETFEHRLNSDYQFIFSDWIAEMEDWFLSISIDISWELWSGNAYIQQHVLSRGSVWRRFDVF